MRTKKAVRTEMSMSASTIYRVSFTLAAIDVMVAAVCAANGDANFVAFMVLAGLMYAHGIYFRAKAIEKEIGE
jgi:hypothetical protein